MLKIANTCKSLKELEQNCESSGVQEAELEKELRQKEKSRYDALNTLNRTAGELQMAVKDLKTLREKYDALEREKTVKELKLNELEERSKKNLEVLDRLEKSHEKTEREKEEITDKYNNFLETERKLRLPELRQALSSAVSKVEKYEQSVQQSQKIIAKLTADNLVFLTKFKDAEERFRVCDMKREELQLMVDEQKGPWFDKVKGDIQKQVESDWQKIHSLEKELSSAEQESKQVISQLNEKLSAVNAENQELKEKNGAMEATIKTTKAKEKQREEKDIKAAADFESLNQLLKDTLAANKVLRETISDERHSIADLTLETQDNSQVIKKLRDELERRNASSSDLKAKLENERRALDAQKKINKVLMNRKEEIEWKLMELTVQSESGIDTKTSEAVEEGQELTLEEEEQQVTAAAEAEHEQQGEEENEDDSKIAVKDEANESNFSFEILDKEENKLEEVPEKSNEEEVQKTEVVSNEDKVEEPAEDGGSKNNVVGLTEKNLASYLQQPKGKGEIPERNYDESTISDEGRNQDITKLENTIVTSKEEHQQMLDRIYGTTVREENIENPLIVHRRIVNNILDGETLGSIPTAIPAAEPSSADATIASMLQETITENSSIGELEASISMAKEEYAKMMENFSTIVDNLRAEDMAGLSYSTEMPILPESIQRMAEHQFADHYEIEDENKSESKERMAVSEIKVSEWLNSKIDEEWRKQLMPEIEGE